MDDSRKPVPVRKTWSPHLQEFGYLYSPPSGFCGCVDCEAQYRSFNTQLNAAKGYTEAFSKIEAEKVTISYATSIQDDLRFLRRELYTHGNTIVNRWKKKSREKRAAALLKAKPNLYPRKWIPVRIGYEHGKDTWRERPELQDAQILPFLNLEVLRDDPLRFLGLLYYRTKYDPQDWVSFDLRQTRLFWDVGRLRVDFAECGVVLHGPNYGKTVAWNVEQGHRWDIAGFPRGKLVLEAQKILMGFMRSVVEDLLDGVDGEGSSEKWIALANSNFRRSIGSEAWSIFGNQAFSAPVFDINRLVEISKARVAEAEDHLWLLQTDAAYFQAVVKAEIQARMIRERRTDEQMFNQHLAARVWTEPLYKLLEWRWVAREVEHLRIQYLKFRGNIHVGERLPPKFDFALGSLEVLLINLLNAATSHLYKVFPRTAGFEDLYVFDHTQRGKISVSLKPPSQIGTTEELFSRDPLFWCLGQLGADPEDPTMFDAAMLFGFLEEWLDSDTTSAKDKARLQQRLLCEISDVAVLNELLAVVRQHRPVCKVLTTEDVRQKYPDRHVWRRMGKDKFEESVEDHKNVGKCLKVLQDFPFPKGNRDAVWLERADEVRRNLKSYWDEARNLHRRRLDQQKLTDEDRKYELEAMMLDNTPEHLAALKTERDGILAPKVVPPMHDIPTTEWPLKDEKLDLSLPSRPKEKIKSRPNGSQVPSAEEPCTKEAKEFKVTADTIQVKKETFRVLTRMFPVTQEEYSAKPLDWKNFVGAMEDAGFPATQSGGSAVTFAREGEGRIVFHKPHPVAKVEQGMLQAWGKRMKKWFRWERETFEC